MTTQLVKIIDKTFILVYKTYVNVKFTCYSQISAGYYILGTYIELQYFWSILAIEITNRKTKPIDQQLQLTQILNSAGLIIEKIDVKWINSPTKYYYCHKNIILHLWFISQILYAYGNQVPCMYIYLLTIKSLSISEIGPNPDETRNQKAHKQMG